MRLWSVILSLLLIAGTLAACDTSPADVSFAPVPNPAWSLLTADSIPNTADWKTAGLKSVGLGEAEMRDSTTCSLGTAYVLSTPTHSIFGDVYLAVETEDTVWLTAVYDSADAVNFVLCDVDGISGEEIVLNLETDGTGGAGVYDSTVWKITPSGVSRMFVSGWDQPFDTGFEARPQVPFRLVIQNRYTGYETVVDVQDHPDYCFTEFEEDGTPKKAQSPLYMDTFYGFTPEDVDKDGIMELVCTQYASYAFHADGAGDAVSTLKYDPATHTFKVIDARFEPYKD